MALETERRMQELPQHPRNRQKPNLWRVKWISELVFRVSRASRRRKFNLFNEHIQPRASDLVLDVGVTSEHWSCAGRGEAVENYFEASYPWPERIVAVSIDNLDGFHEKYRQTRCLQADACAL